MKFGKITRNSAY